MADDTEVAYKKKVRYRMRSSNLLYMDIKGKGEGKQYIIKYFTCESFFKVIKIACEI